MGRKFIIAGNYAQFLQHCKDNDLKPSRKIIHVQDARRIYGVKLDKDDEFVYVGTWYERHDLNDIKEVVEMLEAVRG